MTKESLAALGTGQTMLYMPYIPEPTALLGGRCVVSSTILDMVGQRLCRKTIEGDIKLELLENCLHAPDGITYRFKLKKGQRFQDGTELTANDIVTQLTASSHLAIDPCLYIASIKRTSRYGFDIVTTDKSVDLLGYLAHRAFTICKKAEGCAAGYAFTGARAIAEWTSTCVRIVRCDESEDSEDTPWELKVIKIGASGIDLFHNHPFSYLYLGHTYKERQISQLTNIVSERLESGYSYLLALDPALEQREYIKEKLTLASYMCFSRDRSYHRLPLESFFPKKHPLYMPFKKPARFEPLPAALPITLLVQDATLTDKLLDRYHTACLNQGIHVSFTRAAGEASDGTIHSFSHDPNFPAFDVMEFFSAPPLQKALKASPRLWQVWRKAIKSPASAVQERFIRSLLRDLLAAGPFVPLFYSFFVVKTNLPVTRKNSHSITLDFSFNPRTAAGANPDLEKFKTEALASLGQAIQMFAHDVKKPFSMMYSMLSLMANIDDGEELKALSRRYVAEVRGTMDTVTTMLSDIVEIGSDTTVHKEAHSLRSLLASVFWEVFAYSDDRPVALNYHFGHYHKVNVDAPKVTRVLANIIVNACQAMAAARSGGVEFEEALTFETSEVLHNNQLALKLSIHNTGTFIPADRLAAVFNLFFTQGKDSGTGLGLAICKKIVLEHGGKIWAQSQKGKGTAFIVVLPVSLDQLEDTALALPRTSAAVAAMADEHHQPDDGEAAALAAIAATLTRPVKILIVDDEPLYLTLFSLLIASEPQLARHIELHTAKNAFQALTTTEHIGPDIIVMDIDLGKLSDDGFEVVRKIRAGGSKAKICIHSNRSWQDDQHLSLQAEADFFLPKPMTKANILRLIANGLPPTEAKAEPTDRALCVAVLDDDPFVHDMLKDVSSRQGLTWQWHSFTSAADLLAALSSGTLTGLDVVLIDYFLQPSAKGGDQGPAIAIKIKQLQPELPAVLMTDKPSVTAAEQKPFVATVTKDGAAIVSSLPNILKALKKP